MTGAHLIGEVTQIPRGEGRAFLVAGQRIAVFRTRSGEVFATQAECPHLQGPLADGLIGGATVICPLHERAYDLRTGEGLNGECGKLRLYPISLGPDGKIWLSTEARPSQRAIRQVTQMAGHQVDESRTGSVVPMQLARGRSERGMKTFIRVAEIWVPTEDRTQLQYLDGLYGPLDQFRQVSEAMRFGFDEGLPGKAWASGHPIILKEFENSYFKRTEAAKAVGLTCGVALPVFAGDRLMAVVVFFCGDDAAHVGAIELWHNDPDTSYEMRLADGYYGTADMFEFNSRYTRFPRGFGLPGRAWKSNMPLIVKDLYRSTAFLRWQEAMEIGINRGLGIPYPHASGQTWVMTFLSARDTPLARRFEIWVPNAARDALVFHSGDCDQNTALETDYRSATIGQYDGTIGDVWRRGIPALRASMADDASPAGRSAAAAGLDAMVAVPVFDGQGLKVVVVWYF